MSYRLIITAKSKEFTPELFDRAKKGDTSILKDFSPDILSVKYGDEDSTCLHELAKNGVVAINNLPSQYLIIQDNTGRTPIHYLAMTNSASQWKNFKQAAFEVQDEDGKTPLHILAEHFDVSSAPAKFLKIKDYEDYNTPVHVMCESGVVFNVSSIPELVMRQANVLGETPAHLLAYNANKEFVKCPTQDVKNANGQTPMEIYEERATANAEEVTAGLKPYLLKRKKILDVLRNYIDIEGLRYYWDVGPKAKIYTHTFDNGDTLSFSLFKTDIRNGLQLNCTMSELPIRDNYIRVIALISGAPGIARDVLVEHLEEKGVYCYDINSDRGEEVEEVTSNAEVVVALTSKRRKSASELAKMKIKRKQNRVKLKMQRLRRKNKVKSVKRQRAAKRAHKTRKRLYGV